MIYMRPIKNLDPPLRIKQGSRQIETESTSMLIGLNMWWYISILILKIECDSIDVKGFEPM